MTTNVIGEIITWTTIFLIALYCLRKLLDLMREFVVLQPRQVPQKSSVPKGDTSSKSTQEVRVKSHLDSEPGTKTLITPLVVDRLPYIVLDSKRLDFDQRAFSKKIHEFELEAEQYAGDIEIADFIPGEQYFEQNRDLWQRTRQAGIQYNKASKFVKSQIAYLSQISPKDLSYNDRQKLAGLLSPKGVASVQRDLERKAAKMFRKNLQFRDLIGQECGRRGEIWARKKKENSEAYHDRHSRNS